MMDLHLSIRLESQMNKARGSYYLQSVTIRVAQNIVAGISILQVWHNNKWSVVELIRTEEF